MDQFSQPEIIKLAALAGAFVVGVAICGFVIVKDSIELKKRREAKRLMYQDEVNRELRRRQEKRRLAEEEQQRSFQTFAL